jgi:hypothetical protein
MIVERGIPFDTAAKGLDAGSRRKARRDGCLMDGQHNEEMRR